MMRGRIRQIITVSQPWNLCCSVSAFPTFLTAGNTGERFQIKGHTKVSFSPDANLRDTINKPFAHFETVVLNENKILEDTPIEETEEEETGEEASAQAAVSYTHLDVYTRQG